MCLPAAPRTRSASGHANVQGLTLIAAAYTTQWHPFADTSPDAAAPDAVAPGASFPAAAADTPKLQEVFGEGRVGSLGSVPVVLHGGYDFLRGRFGLSLAFGFS